MSNMYCCVPGCNSWAKKNPKLSFHEFPESGKRNVKIVNKMGNQEIVDQHLAWVLKLRIGKQVKSKHMYVCSLHFEESDYFPREESGKRKRILKRTTVPSQNLPSSTVIIQSYKTTRKERQKMKRTCTSIETNHPSTSKEIHECSLESNEATDPIVHSEEQLAAAETLLNLLESGANDSGPSDVRDFAVQVNTPEKLTISKLITTEKSLNSFTEPNSFEMLSEITKMLKINFSDKKLHQLTLTDRIILTFVELKTNLTYVILSVLFGISRQACELYIQDMIPKIAAIQKPVIYFPSSEEISKNMPACFKNFQNVRVILDCTEINIQKPKCLCCRIRFYSHYKTKETIKFMVGVSPAGIITFVSEPYGGRASDKIIFEESDIIFKLNKSKDAIMVDKGFLIDDICISNDIELIRPPFLKQQEQLSAEEAKLNAEIAAARVHIERMNQRIKIFKILSDKLQWSFVPQINNIFTILCGISNLSSPILSADRFM